MTERRVAITGLGCVTPCGKGWQPYWDAACRGVSAIGPVRGMGINGSPVRFAGEVLDFDPAEFVKQRKMLKLMSREIQIVLAAGQLAIGDAGLVLEGLDRFRTGVSLGAGIINKEIDEMGAAIRNGLDAAGRFQMARFGTDGIRTLFPLWFLKYLPNMPACHASIAFGLQGPSNTVTTSAAAATQAIGEAFEVIRRGDADVMLAGGTDCKVNAMGMALFYMLNMLSLGRKDGPPAEGYRPFDVRHDGMIVGEGAGILVLEELDHARRRGARIYGQIAGYGCASGFAEEETTEGPAQEKGAAMKQALDQAALDPKDIGFLVADGSGIPADDAREAGQIREVFGTAIGGLKVTALKPVTGHLVFSAGGVEMAAATLALFNGLVPPVMNLEKPAPECELPFVKGKAEPVDARSFLFHSCGFGGQNACLAVRRV